jgi:Cdc6-like AAA superfamily ATPase
MTFSEKRILLRPIRSVPGWLSQRFFGRDEELAWLESVLEPGSPHKSGRRVALWGMTGIGKTQLVSISTRKIFSLQKLTGGFARRC